MSLQKKIFKSMVKNYRAWASERYFFYYRSKHGRHTDERFKWKFLKTCGVAIDFYTDHDLKLSVNVLIENLKIFRSLNKSFMAYPSISISLLARISRSKLD